VSWPCMGWRADISSEVYQGIRRRTGHVVALKKILMHQEKDGVGDWGDAMAPAYG
jgi:hypothetical protein